MEKNLTFEKKRFIMRNLVWTNASLWWWVSWSWAMRIALFYVRMRHEESRNEEISTRTCKTKKKSVWFRTLSPRRQQESSLKTRNEPISVSVMVIWRKLKLFKCSHSIRNAERPKTFQFPARMSTTLSSSNRRKKKNRDWTEEFDPGSDWTLAACFTHASRTAAQGACSWVASGARVSNTSERVLLWGITARKGG